MAYTFEHCREQKSISIEPNYIFKHVLSCDNYMDTKHLSKYLKFEYNNAWFTSSHSCLWMQTNGFNQALKLTNCFNECFVQTTIKLQCIRLPVQYWISNVRFTLANVWVGGLSALNVPKSDYTRALSFVDYLH